jgi:hypothetical protein
MSFCFLALTGVVLYTVPHGRVAYWADWRLWNLAKEEWESIHMNMPLLFLIASGFHIYYNWKPILAYLRNRARKLVIFSREFTVALGVAAVFVLSTYFAIPPFNNVIEISEKIKDRHERVYGSPPYGHAELSSLETFCKKMHLDLDRSMEILAQNNITATSEKQTLKEMARVNGLSPQQIYLLMKDGKKIANSLPSDGLAGEPVPSGMGRKTLAQVAKEYDLDIKAGLIKLRGHNVQATQDMTFQEIAEAEGMAPIDVLEMMK